MAIHMQVSVHLHHQIKQTMPGKAFQHMVKKTDSRLNIRFS